MAKSTKAKVSVEKTNYKGWPNCCRIANKLVDLIVTTDVGPRIIRYGFVTEENELKEYEEMLGKRGGSQWRIYGGHRLWHAPEGQPRSYFPDNAPVKVEKLPNGARFIQTTEKTTGIQKEIDVKLALADTHVTVTHRLRNTNLWPIDLAPWALTVMPQGGAIVIPLPPRGSHPKDLLPANTLTLWPYTDLSDRRWTWGNKYIILRQDPKAALPQKIGAMVPDGWVGFTRHTHLFLKKFAYIKGALYPDFGCCVETFTNEDMLEVETLGPLARLEPGAGVEHVEHWFLFRDVPIPDDDGEVDRTVLPKVKLAKI